MSKLLIPNHYTQREKNLDALSEVSHEEMASNLWGAPILNPMLCDERFLDALGAFYGINVEDFEPDKKRTAIAASIPARRIRGTRGAVSMLLSSAGIECEIDEDTGIPFTFGINLKIANDIKRLSSITKLIDYTKNERSHYFVNLDYETDAPYFAGSAAITEMGIDLGINIAAESNMSAQSGQCFRIDPAAEPVFVHEVLSALSTAAAIDYDAHTQGMLVERGAALHAASAGIIRIDIGQAGADVMHLPIPPVIVGTSMTQLSGAVLEMTFGIGTADLWHLDHHIDYGSSSAWYCSGGVCSFDSQWNGDLEAGAYAEVLFASAGIINLDIGGK
ncbi:MAG: phage tail protein [Sulfuricurvum sp.]|nr:phage tail protein [Sulfuricurvum sp.]